MKKLIVVATLIALASFTSIAKAETVTCSSEQYGGAVCGISTSETIEHKITETNTGANDSQMIKLLLSIAGAAALATGLYKLTYKSYLLG
jgi:ATP-dependent Clp protease adapter protein ClpS